MAKPEWNVTHASYLTGRSYLDGAEAIAHEIETFWGLGRLRLLVSPELRARFDRQRYRLQQAIQYGSLEDVRVEAARTRMAYKVLDAKAKEDGHTPQPVEAWEVALADGTVACLVRNEADAKALVASGYGKGRSVAVWTLPEIARLLALHAKSIKAAHTLAGEPVDAPAAVLDPLEAILHPTGLDSGLDDRAGDMFS